MRRAARDRGGRAGRHRLRWRRQRRRGDAGATGGGERLHRRHRPPAADRLLRGSAVRDRAARRPLARVRRRAGRDGPDREGRPEGRQAVPRRQRHHQLGRRARPAVAGVRSRLRAVGPVLRLLHGPRRGRADRRVQAPYRRRGRSGLRPPGHPVPGLRAQPQRRPRAVRPRQAALHRHRRRRRGRRPARPDRPRPGAQHAARQDRADRSAPLRLAGLLGAAQQPVRRPLRRQAGDLQLRAAQPVAVLVRPPDRRPDHRRRRPERDRGGQLRPPRQGPGSELRLACVRGSRPLHVRRACPRRGDAGDHREPRRRQLLDHRRGRDPRPEPVRLARSLRLRRPVPRRAPDRRPVDRARPQQAGPQARGGPPVLVRRGRRRAASTSRRSAAPSTGWSSVDHAHPRAEPGAADALGDEHLGRRPRPGLGRRSGPGDRLASAGRCG